MMRFFFLKHNPVVVGIYNALLSYRCKSVKRFFFVATTGRSGSESLSEAFKIVPGAVSLHEPYPVMYNDYAAEMDRDKYFERIFWKVKRINIKRAAAGHAYYLETNHQFVKNFIASAMACFQEKIGVIHLVRDPVKVAASFFAVGSIPGKTPQGKLYLLNPTDETNTIQISDLLFSRQDFAHDYFKCLWYWYETEARIKQLKQQYASVPWIRLETEALNSVDKMKNFFCQLNVDVDHDQLKSLVGIRRNTKGRNKTQVIGQAECDAMHEKLKKEMEKRYGPEFWR